MKDSYVQALTKSILSGTEVEVALQNLKAVLVKKGHLRLWSQILRRTLRELSAKLKVDTPQVTLAQAGGVSAETIEAAIAKLGSTITPQVHIDETLVGGFTARVKDRFIDASYKHKLLTLYLATVRGE